MWHWFRKNKKDYPKFWEEYCASFSAKTNSSERLVVFDTETTGLDLKNDVILSIGAIAIVNSRIILKDSFECFVEQENYKPNQIAIHGILKEGKTEKNTEIEAIVSFISYIKNATLIGHHIAFDIAMINGALKRMGLPKLKNKSIDTDAIYQKYKNLSPEQHTTLDALCGNFKIPKSDRHTASGDAYLTALVYLKLKAKM
ncbi:MAG: 3'-5' exonuclease [Flavobacteriaceae bacterium CG_4_8_14_3_um_filter_34_10]|nr:3'-5' exonuclease [Flavobacteriia bacterium]OIP51639.1 MAG: DNA polymerase III subunit epsilon [Flavobacteriaceae bacterium CG2_30_34_30]PIQ17264.1 MAG: DNA polymerase III subunit epsilon [Flavobacteriaceae bacterium CG18_big_fil_WC_8_21_14_2_50_34_36]PIV48584.1 MAG: 3'-5' exonuclease [Flavobacteriaceae bacterium CG02_land_8_20_14_3_00_34_13]PIX10084.1 MAG: 3'-5' exonuclease [Flavobacteriaceae bacterium CG_4_8_14_3_um_filter_34_10]PIZ07028.1 MAG: 3'-5' exonuclease [Flavobacteriaceae bacteri